MRGWTTEFHHCRECGGVMELVADRQGADGEDYLMCCRYCGQEVQIPVQAPAAGRTHVEPATPRLPAVAPLTHPS